MIATRIPRILETLWHLVNVLDLIDRHALIGVVQHLIVEMPIGVALAFEHFLDTIIAPARPVVRGKHDLRLLTIEEQRPGNELGPGQRIAHLRATQCVDVVDRAGHVFGHPQCLLIGQVGVHLRWRFGARRILEDHAHTIDVEFLNRIFDHARWRQQAQVSRRNVLHQPLTRVPERARRQQHAILEEQAPVHRVAGVDVLRDGLLHEADWRNDLDLAGCQSLRIDDTTHAAEVVCVRVRVDHCGDGQFLDLLVDQLEARSRRLERRCRIENDPALFAADKGDVGKVQSAHLIYAVNHFVKPGNLVQVSLAFGRGVHGVELTVFRQELIALYIPGNVSGIRLDDHRLERGNETLARLVEVPRVVERHSFARFTDDLQRVLGRRLTLRVEVLIRIRVDDTAGTTGGQGYAGQWRQYAKGKTQLEKVHGQTPLFWLRVLCLE